MKGDDQRPKQASKLSPHTLPRTLHRYNRRCWNLSCLWSYVLNTKRMGYYSNELIAPRCNDACRVSHVSVTLRRILRLSSHSHRFLSSFQNTKGVKRQIFFDSWFHLSSYQKLFSFYLHLLHKAAVEIT